MAWISLSAVFHLDVVTSVRLNPTGVTLRATLLLGLLFVVVVWCYLMFSPFSDFTTVVDIISSALLLANLVLYRKLVIKQQI